MESVVPLECDAPIETIVHAINELKYSDRKREIDIGRLSKFDSDFQLEIFKDRTKQTEELKDHIDAGNKAAAISMAAEFAKFDAKLAVTDSAMKEISKRVYQLEQAPAKKALTGQEKIKTMLFDMTLSHFIGILLAIVTTALTFAILKNS